MGLRDKYTAHSLVSTAFKVPFVYFGNEALATGVNSDGAILKKLIENQWIPEVILLAQRKPSKKKHAVEAIAEHNDIPVVYIRNKTEMVEIIDQHQPTFAVLAAFGMIITKDVLASIPHGIVNIHPSLLPRYRGTSPIEQTIIDGSSETGVSLMKLDEGMDTGPLYEQRTLEKDASSLSKQELHDELVKLGSEMLLNHIDSIASGAATTSPQKEEDTSTTKLITKEDSSIDWTQSAAEIERHIRAYAGWPKSHTTIAGHNVIIHETNITDSKPDGSPGKVQTNNHQLLIDASDHQLEITRLQPEGKKVMAASDFINGYLN